MLEDKILKEYRNVAVVGLSPKSDRPSYRVASYLDQHGYRIIPVSPNAQQILGKTSYPNLSSIPETVEVVDIFRRADKVMPIIEEAIKVGAKVVWMQEGIINE
ncbi:MAG: CoA-binding protein, partial [Dehalococcoidales bacterium]